MKTTILLTLLSILILLALPVVFSQPLHPGVTQFTLGIPIVTDFDVWLGADRIMLSVGKKAEVRLYVKNTGNGIDSYNVYVQLTSLKVECDNRINDVYPQDVKFTSLIVSSTTTGTQTAYITVCSENQPAFCKAVTLSVEVFAPKSLPEFNNVSILLLFILSLMSLIHVVK